MIILHSLSKLWKRVLNKSMGQSKLKNMISQELYLTPSKRCNGIQESMNCNIELKPDMNLNKKSSLMVDIHPWLGTQQMLNTPTNSSKQKMLIYKLGIAFNRESQTLLKSF